MLQMYRCMLRRSEAGGRQRIYLRGTHRRDRKDRPFYRLYGGGVTFSGGEPLTHGKYLAAAAMLCRQKGINVTVESCGYGNRDDFKEALPYIDAMFIDIKHIDSDRHREMTGVGNEEILKISAISAQRGCRSP